MMFVIMLIASVLLILSAAALMCAWAYRDAKARGVPNPSLWAIVVILGQNLTGLIVYLLVGRKEGHAPGVKPGKYIAGIAVVLAAGMAVFITAMFSMDGAGLDFAYTKQKVMNSYGNIWKAEYQFSNEIMERHFRIKDGKPDTILYDFSAEDGNMKLICITDSAVEVFAEGKGVIPLESDSGSVKLLLVNRDVDSGKFDIYWE